MNGNPGGSVRGIVLAGGESTRFAGGNKALAEVDGRPIIVRVLEALAAATNAKPLVVVRNEEQRESLGRALEGTSNGPIEVDPNFTRDHPDLAGPLAGVVGACHATGASWLFVTACDMPLLDREAVCELVRRTGSNGVDAIVPADESGRQPLHALYRRGSVVAARESLSPNASLHALLAELDTVTEVEPTSTAADLRRSLTNVNTVEELAAIREGRNGVGRDRNPAGDDVDTSSSG